MTDSDLQTCRAWCAANGVEVRKTKWEAFAWEAFGLPDWFPKDASGYAAHFEQQAYDLIWKHLGPWLASVRNLDAVEVEGPYAVFQWATTDEPKTYGVCRQFGGPAVIFSEQTARTITNLLNRECGK